MTTNETETTPRRPRWLKALLIASLGLNLLFIGGAAGAFWKHRHRGPYGETGLLGFVRQLPAAKYTDLKSYVASEREKLKALQDAVRAGWTETNAILGEEPFDKEKLKAAMGRTIEAETRRHTAIADTLVETASKLTAEERKALKAWRERSRERSHKRWRRHWDKDGRDTREGG